MTCREAQRPSTRRRIAPISLAPFCQSPARGAAVKVRYTPRFCVSGGNMKLVRPHGSEELRPLLVDADALQAERLRAASLPRLRITSREAGDLIMLGIGGFTPLDGFMGHDDWKRICTEMRRSDGLFWPIPITLSASQA